MTGTAKRRRPASRSRKAVDAAGLEEFVEGQDHGKQNETDQEDELTSPAQDVQDTIVEAVDPAQRPKRLTDFAGQADLLARLRIAINAARDRGEPLDHVLFFGPPGLGKTTLAQIVAGEMGYSFQATSAPAIAKPGDMASILTSMSPWSVLFIDEIHRLNKVVSEMLYTAMEDFHLDLLIGEGPSTRSVRIELPPFTMVGATTRPGMLAAPLRDRFGLHLRLDYYAPEDLARIIERSAGLMDLPGDHDGFFEIARRSRGTPRIAKRLLRRVRDHAHDANDSRVTLEVARRSLDVEGIDPLGLNAQDRRYLDMIAKGFSGGPVGIETLCAALSEDREIVESAIEPYLMTLGLVQRTPRGRALTDNGRALLRASPANGPFSSPFNGAQAGQPIPVSDFTDRSAVLAPPKIVEALPLPGDILQQRLDGF